MASTKPPTQETTTTTQAKSGITAHEGSSEMLTATARSIWSASHPAARGARRPRVDRTPVAGGQRDAVEGVRGEEPDRLALRALEPLRQVGRGAAVRQHEDIDAVGDVIDPGVEQWPDADPHIELLGDLACHAVLRRLARLQLAAGQLPLPAQVADEHDAAVTQQHALHGDREARRAIVERLDHHQAA